MKRTIFGICLLAISLFFIISAGNCRWEYFFNPIYGHGLDGNFGSYRFDDPADVQNFNIRVKKWFTQRGFTELKDKTYKDIRTTDAQRPGELLLFTDASGSPGERAPGRWIYIFLPDAEDNIQRVEYFGYQQGIPKESEKYENDFKELEKSFLKEFPQGDYTR